ncbi:branched-chain amino acid aminotransferase [Falsarthrobacter nasiphocae]|uniref:Branched-chain-amino-acid aminotransferase n=2 Tax=Falsarthrobacter nasiphocae TaxID=189863 RepID=A0AAE4C8W7_9MICC|nr:branched-chain amino acid aminotransferase [Falsarthrobacter nasiphocae]MDR6892825.1 branched-chain amino acid aminotransferase [Falsarthrobacter nasiphocae]
MTLSFDRRLSENPASPERRAEILAAPAFGTIFTDHMAVVDYSEEKGWHNARIEPYGPISLDPAAAVFHYGQEIFEGLKAYKNAEGTVGLFRPEANAERLRRSAERLMMADLPVDIFVDACRELVDVEAEWIPTGPGESLYLRPFMIATEAFLGIRPSKTYTFCVIASPAGNYFGGDVRPVKIWVEREYARAGRGGTGAAKCGGNYASSLKPQVLAAQKGCDQVVYLDPLNDNAIEELGGMNVFFVVDGDTLVTPALSGSILEGITRSSILTLAAEKGLAVEERKVTLDEFRELAASGRVSEVFACGTAAVVTPIGALYDGDDVIGDPDAPAGPVTQQIREELLGIQTGAVEDRHGWVTRVR